MKKALVLSGGGARGAYQAGVYKYLSEIEFKPDIICGTSVGSINATAIGCGMDSEKLINLWQAIEVKSVINYSYWKIVRDLIMRRFAPMAETAPMRKLLEEHLDFSKLKKNSAQEIYISAVNILTSELKFFTNQEIGIQHVMASSSIPVIFPWQYVDGIPFWDGGLMANTPIFPAIERGATDVIVVLLSPVGGEEVPLPRNRKEAVERAFELSLIGSYQMALHNEIEQTPLRRFVTFFESYGKQEKIKIRTIYPKNSLGLSSIMNFTAKQSDRLIRMGYEDAKEIL